MATPQRLRHQSEQTVAFMLDAVMDRAVDHCVLGVDINEADEYLSGVRGLFAVGRK